MTPVFALPFLSPQDIIIILVVGVLLFGRKLPEIGGYIGKGIVEFKRGLSGAEAESPVTQSTEVPTANNLPRPPQRVGTAAPKFEEVQVRA